MTFVLVPLKVMAGWRVVFYDARGQVLGVHPGPEPTLSGRPWR